MSPLQPFITQRYAYVTHLGKRGTPEAVGTYANYKSLFTSCSQNLEAKSLLMCALALQCDRFV
ncbi:MAG: hypothetical protein RMZ43_009790 [Nostoc sp. CmiVER01]|uniref:hypothetical protein n=1 Tax=Nostoc sp. CmiVER01 TaxID=3075384 RepID=UPI002AD2003A|nr:hypothetical protein [Nostoc sp. CmiVER01]MDZ8123586.1 hypothetical protein [Nostoc sp. CmiVER01]